MDGPGGHGPFLLLLISAPDYQPDLPSLASEKRGGVAFLEVYKYAMGVQGVLIRLMDRLVA